MRAEALAEKRKQRGLRQEWVRNKLEEVSHTSQDAADICEVNPRTWRSWIAQGSFPESQQCNIIYVLYAEEAVAEEVAVERIEEISRYFDWH